MSVEQIEDELNRALEGLTPIEKGLTIAQVLRDECGGKWSIGMWADGRFSITKVLPDEKKPV